MKKILSLLLLISTLSYGCATCMLVTPTVEVEIELNIEEKQLNKIDFTWNFSNYYTKELILQYDKNNNYKLDENELNEIKQAMLDYLKPKNMITSINYASPNDLKSKALSAKYENFNLNIVNDALVFTYNATLFQEILHNSSLSISIVDDKEYFILNIVNINTNECSFNYSENLYLFTASVLFEDKSIVKEKPKPTITKKLEPNKTTIQEPTTTISSKENLLQNILNKVKSTFESIKNEQNTLSYLLLLVFAFSYGVIHAIGPGHGKTLVASYFLSNDRSYKKAFFISMAIGVVHTFSAFILTLIIYFIVNTLLAQFLDDTIYYTTKISALIIIGIALYLIRKKYLLYKQIETKNNTPLKFSTTPVHISTCACSSCKVDKNSTDVALIISAGIIPCPGTTTLFIFAISMGLYSVGFMSALVMSFGMSSVIFLSALFSTLVRKKALSQNHKLKKYLEFISLLLILGLGGILFIT